VSRQPRDGAPHHERSACGNWKQRLRDGSDPRSGGSRRSQATRAPCLPGGEPRLQSMTTDGSMGDEPLGKRPGDHEAARAFDLAAAAIRRAVEDRGGFARSALTADVMGARSAPAALNAGVGGDDELHPIIFDGQLAALAGRHRCYFLTDDLTDERYRRVAAMCLCSREVRAGRLEGPFTAELAERWADAFLRLGG
jgi:hypothetical protein